VWRHWRVWLSQPEAICEAEWIPVDWAEVVWWLVTRDVCGDTHSELPEDLWGYESEQLKRLAEQGCWWVVVLWEEVSSDEESENTEHSGSSLLWHWIHRPDAESATIASVITAIRICYLPDIRPGPLSTWFLDLTATYLGRIIYLPPFHLIFQWIKSSKWQKWGFIPTFTLSSFTRHTILNSCDSLPSW
jgi:hypothetical protein